MAVRPYPDMVELKLLALTSVTILYIYSTCSVRTIVIPVSSHNTCELFKKVFHIYFEDKQWSFASRITANTRLRLGLTEFYSLWSEIQRRGFASKELNNTPRQYNRGALLPLFFFLFFFFYFHLFHFFFLTVICLSAELHDNDRTLRLRPTLRSSTEATVPQCGFAPQQVAIRGFAPA